MTQRIDLETRNVLRLCENIELACAELYHYFADLFISDRESFLLWLKTAMAEENQAKRFVLLGKLQRANVIKSIQVEPSEAKGSLLYVKSLIESAKRHPPSMPEALRMAIDLEARLRLFTMENVIKFTDNSYQRSFMAIADSRHLESLRVAYGMLNTA